MGKSAAAGVATGAVTIASRDVERRRGSRVESGAYLGLADGEPIAGGQASTPSDHGRRAVSSRARDVLTFITGEDEPELGPLLARVAERHPDLELEVHPGGQPHYPLLLAAE